MRYEVPVNVSGADERPAVVVLWSAQAPSERSKVRLAVRAAALLGAPVEDLRLARSCPRCGSDRHGRPHVVGRRDLAVSLSATDAVTAVAVTRGEPVGLDVEHPDEARFTGVGDVLLHPEEEAPEVGDLARTWVRKESLLKAVGVGLGADPRSVHLSAAGEPPELLGPLPGVTSRVWLEDLALTPLVLGCVAVLAPRRPVVRVTEVAAEEPLS